MNEQRIDALARRHQPGSPPVSCDRHDAPCDAAELASELARVRAWADFASDLLDAHIWGFPSGDWQAGEALASALWGEDWPPAWSRDPEDAAHIVVDPALWPTTRTGDEIVHQGRFREGDFLDTHA